ncbi:MAG: SbcC/MukB-like Walker B domain-containing protein, partial [Pseudonocardia sp.]
AARDALAAGPDRTALQRWRAAQDELGATLDGLPGLVEALAAASAALAAASADAATAHVALEDARKARDATREAAASAAAEVNRLAAERELLAVPDGPGGLADLDERRAAAELGARRAARELTAAEEAEARARADAGAAPARAPLEEARRRHGELAALRERRTRAVAARTAAEEAAAAAGAATDAAAARWEQARGRLEALQRADVAATLRPVLAVGEECPVCAQRIATLPPELPVADLHVARHALAAAEEEHDECRGVHGRAASTLAVAVAELERLDGETVRVAELLHEAAGAAGLLGPEPQAGASGGPDRPGSGPGDTADGPAGPGEGPRGRGAVPAVRAVAVEAVDAALVERERADRAVADADTALRAARRARDAAAAQAEAARTAEAEAIERLRAAREPLAPLGAPTLPAGALAGWRQLADWVRAEAAARDEELAAGRSAWVAAEAEQADADGAFAAAEREEERRRRAETRAERAEQETDGHVRLAERRAATLRAELAGAPSPAEIAAELARSSALEQRARTAAAALRAARVARQEAERAVADVARRVTAAWEVLRGARDPLVALGAPALAGDALGPAWEGLVTWAVVAAAARDAGLAEAEAAITRARDERARLAGRLADALAGRGIDPADVVASPGTALVDPRRAALAVTAALGTVRAAHARIAERRADADLLRSDRATALEEQQVARLLGQQLRSDRFPRWLMNSVLDTLVADASEILAELSGGQFALTHDDRGDFQVIDHADADTRRPVKTLSGGETFQASLAMALALSGQLGGLAARSATRLESIFLDEGFGTLDESNLDIVATTLETLAAGGDRMVGVVTHVPALAERVPVRFVLRRDGRTSSIEREER